MVTRQRNKRYSRVRTKETIALPVDDLECRLKKENEKNCNGDIKGREYSIILCDNHYVLINVDPEDWDDWKEVTRGYPTT